MAEVALCHFSKSMSVNPDKAALPVTIEKTFETKTVKLEVAVPTEAWATTLGYDAVATVTIDGGAHMKLYWGGTATESKGFLVQAPNGFNDKKTPVYVQWDRTGDDQFVKVFGTMFTTSYLGSFADGDRAMYGKATYNKTSKAVATQIVAIEPNRGGAVTAFGCFRMFSTGVKDGAVKIGKTSSGTAGHAVGATFTDETGMDMASLTDSIATANGTGNITDSGDTELAANGLTVAFDKTCASVNTAGSSGAFSTADSVVSFTLSPTDVFGI